MRMVLSELRKMLDDVRAILNSPSKMFALVRIPLYANAFYLLLANVSNTVFGFFFWIIAARLYNAASVGIGSAIISAVTLLELLSCLGLGYGMVRFIKSSNNPVNLINSALTLTGIISLIAAGIFIIGLDLWSPALNIIQKNIFFLFIFLFLVPIQVLDDLTDQVMMGERHASFIFIHLIIFNIFRLILLVLMVDFSQSLGIFSSYGTATLIALLISLFILLPRAQSMYRISFIIDRKALLTVLHFSFLNYLSDLFWSVPGLVLPIIIVNMLGAAKNAYFFIAWAIGNILGVIPGALASSLLAEGTYDESHLKNHVLSSLKMVALILVPAVTLVWFLADKFLLLYGGIYAANAVTLLHWLAIAAFPLAINTIYFTIKRVQKNIKSVIMLAALMAVIVIIASYLLLPRMGINGVGIAWLTGQSVVALIAIVWDVRNWVSV